jgi:predicted nucleic acid-binding protein
MAKSVLVDAGFLVALLGRRDAHHTWAVTQVHRFPPPWNSCEAVLSEAFHLLGAGGLMPLGELLRREKLMLDFELDKNLERVLGLMNKYVNLPMSFADACLVRMTEAHADPVLLTTDSDFRIYRRHGRQVVPCVLP